MIICERLIVEPLEPHANMILGEFSKASFLRQVSPMSSRILPRIPFKLLSSVCSALQPAFKVVVPFTNFSISSLHFSYLKNESQRDCHLLFLQVDEHLRGRDFWAADAHPVIADSARAELCKSRHHFRRQVLAIAFTCEWSLIRE